jgi:ribosomal protein L19E
LLEKLVLLIATRREEARIRKEIEEKELEEAREADKREGKKNARRPQEMG